MPRKGPDNRPLMLKIRVRVTRPMNRADVWKKVKQAIRTRLVPDGIEIAYLDWAKMANSGGWRTGRLPGYMVDDLRAFMGAVNKAEDPRIERVDRS